MKDFVTKVMKSLGFFLLAAVVFIGFIYPFSLVPKLYENRAREMTLERVSNGSIAVKDDYIEESIRDAVTGNVDNIFTTAFYIAAAVAIVIFFLSLRPPHDCGGINWFNPIGLIFVAAATFLTAIIAGLIIKNSSAKSASDFAVLVRSLTSGFSFEDNRVFLIVIVPVVMEIVFRGIIFSYLEKIHFSVALTLSSLLYAVAAYLIVGNYTKYGTGSSSPALCAFFIALLIGSVEGVIVWRLRSVIPAVLSHMLIAYTSANVYAFVNEGSVTLAPMIIALVLTLCAFVFVHTFLAKKLPVFAYDFPFSAHHERMREWFGGPLFLRGAKKAEGEEKKAEKKEKQEKSKPAKKSEPKKSASSSKKSGGSQKSSGKKGKKGKK